MLILEDIKVAYRETIKGSSDVQGKHKKQSGGHGQYGDVKIRFTRTKDDFDLMKKYLEVQFLNLIYQR